MRIPFSGELDEVFRSDRSIWWKMGGCAFATTFVCMSALLRSVRNISVPWIAALAGASAASGAVLALTLSLKDVVRRRNDREEPVNLFLNLYFGMGCFSTIAWILTAFVVAFFLAIGTAV